MIENTHRTITVRRSLLALLTCVYVVVWLGGVVQGWRDSSAMVGRSWLAAGFLTLAGLIVLVGTHTKRERLLLLAVACVGFAAEVGGVRFGIPFGSYRYTGALGPTLLGVPPVVAFAWMTLAAYVKQTIALFYLPRPLEILIAAVWLTGLDLLIDPLAANELSYWRWAVKGVFFGVPLTNFAGWLLVSLIFFGILRGKFERSLPARLIGVSLILFFTLLAFSFGNNVVALWGCALLFIDGSSSRLISSLNRFASRVGR